MANLLNRVKVGTSTTGAGTIALGSAVRSTAEGDYLTFPEAGAVSGQSYSYLIQEGNKWAVGDGVYTSGSPGTLTRDASESSWNGSSLANTPLSLGGTAKVSVSARASDLVSGKKLLGTQTNIDDRIIFTGLSDAYDVYEIDIQNFIPGEDDKPINLHTSIDGGGFFSTSSGDYSYQNIYSSTASPSTVAAAGVASAAGILLTPTNVGAATNEVGLSGVIRLIRPAASIRLIVQYDLTYIDSAGALVRVVGGGRRNNTNAVNAVRLFANTETGTTRAGLFKLYGLAKQ